VETHRFKYIENDKYIVEVEFLDKTPFLHVQVFKWSPSVLKELYKVFDRLKTSLVQLGCTHMQTISPNPKFVKLFGGHTVNYFENAEVIQWDLIQ
jgi:hypothetical protein